MAFSDFQHSNKKVITTGETWTSETDIAELKIKDVIGSRSRILKVVIQNPNNGRGGVYSAYQRVRVIDRLLNVVTFLGRIESVKPDHRKQEIELICRDGMGELSEKSNSALSYSDVRRSELIKDIVNTDSDGVFGTGSGKNITTAFHVDTSNYLEQITRQYGNANDGYESLLDSVEKLAQEEAWFPTSCLLWSGNITIPLADVWFLMTAEVHFANNTIMKPQASTADAGTADEMRMYLGSTQKFRAVDFILEAESGIYVSLLVQYWDGSTWTAIASAPNTPSVTDTTNDLEQNGRISFSALPSDWTTRTNLTGVESADNVTGTQRDDSSVSTVDDAASDDLYWIRITIDRSSGSEDPGVIYGLCLLDNDLRPFDSRWDYRMEDPFFGDVIADGDGAGAFTDNTIKSYNSLSTTNFNFLAASGRNFYFGADRRFAGIEFELSTNGNYGNVTITWAYWNGATWTNITDDNSYGFAADGAVRLDTNASTTWVIGDLIQDLGESGGVHGNYYFIRAVVSGAPTTTAVIKTVRTISIASMAFFERGSEPWPWRLRGTTDTSVTTILTDANATFISAGLVGSEVINVTTGATATVTAVTSSTELTVSSAIFGVDGHEYFVSVRKGEDFAGTKADTNQGDTWHGLTLKWRGAWEDQLTPIYRYQLGEQPVEFFTRVIVHGKDGARGIAVNSDREATYGIVKEKILYDWDILTPGAATTKAESTLKTLEPGSTTSVRRGEIEFYGYPAYIFQNKPIAVRAGDIIRLTINDATLSFTNERFLVWGIDYDDGSSLVKLTVTQDLIPALEDTNSINSQMKSVNRAVRQVSWKASVPSQAIGTSFVFHNTGGVYSPESRWVHNEDDTNENQDSLDLANYIGADDTNINPYSGVVGDNWEVAMSIHHALGGAMTFAGATDAEESDIVTGTGKIYYNTDDNLFKMRVEKGEVSETFRHMPVGEWGTVELGSGGEVTITFDNSYSDKPTFLATLDADGFSSPPINKTFEVKSWVQDGNGNYTGVVITTT